MKLHACMLLLLLPCLAIAQQEPRGLSKEGTAVIQDQLHLPELAAVSLGGLLGDRVSRSEQARLLKVDEDELLDGFRHRPGKHPWIGEHVGKWLHAASLSYMNTQDKALREKLDRVATGLIETQEPDGYLGTYEPAKRFGLYELRDWDVWAHKYNLLGLLAYYQATGNACALETGKRVGDLLIQTFGPGKKSILSAGTHVGMAATSVLEPMVLLYRASGEKRYLDFAEYLVGAWEEKDGPRILTSLLAGAPVNKVANGKAYEMLSNLCGLCELYRVTGKQDYLTAVLNAWTDIASNRLYITGSGSAHEHWQQDHDLPNDKANSICETCVTVTWLQFNLQLLRLRGEARFAEELEKTIYNHLLAAQRASGDDWCYYTPLIGQKPFDFGTNCCHSSGPRGVALLPAVVYGAAADGITVNLYTPSRAVLPLPGGGEVAVEQQTTYPLDGVVSLSLTPKDHDAAFAVCLRVPAWSPKAEVQVNGEAQPAPEVKDGWLILLRPWKAGDTVRLSLDLAPRYVVGDHGNAGRAAVLYGPLVLALDAALNPSPLDSFTLTTPLNLHVTSRAERQPLFTTPARLAKDGKSDSVDLTLTPYYACGQDKSDFLIWIKN